jgi:hypothetical protein
LDFGRVQTGFAGFVAFLFCDERVDVSFGQRDLVLVLFSEEFFLCEGRG